MKKAICILLCLVLLAGCGQTKVKKSNQYGYNRETGEVVFPKTTEDISKYYDMTKVELIRKAMVASLPNDCVKPYQLQYQNPKISLAENEMVNDFMKYSDYAVVIENYIVKNMIETLGEGQTLTGEVVCLNPKDDLVLDDQKTFPLNNEITAMLKVFFTKTGFYKVSYTQDIIRFAYLKDGMKQEQEVVYYVKRDQDASYNNVDQEHQLGPGWVYQE